MRRNRLKQVVNIDDVERLARRRLPSAVYHAIAGGATEEVTLRANRQGFDRVWLRPRPLADLSGFDLSTTVLGERVDFPLMLAPTGMARMCDSGAEVALARAAARMGTIFVVSSAASQTLEEIADAARSTDRGTGSLWYQLFIPPNRDATLALLERVKNAGYPVLCVTIDTGVTGKRERDLRNRFNIPIRITPHLILAGVSRPYWACNFLFGRVGRVRAGKGQGVFAARQAYVRFATVIQSMRMPTWDDLRFVRENWDGKLVVKGLMRGDEVAEIIALGADGIVVSNHGGRNVDSVRASIAVLPEVIRAADGRAEVYVDGGIRRGTDVVKALALGARAVLVGRPYLWGLAAGGETGVDTVLMLFKTEIQSTMGLCGLRTIADIDADAIHVD
jgi:isopentenyl diphosphate isomerase/L-lactate dehydrogenase-like FMN-dependent dehydrogenase